MPDKTKSVRILARSLFKQLRQQGYDAREVLALATELLGEVTRHYSATSSAGTRTQSARSS